jgi:flavin reductase (DIM6/NTAB) family NADH-FMN oxidoreductase RutF
MSNPIQPIDPEQLRFAMRRFASGVTIVTASANGRSVGITVSSFTSISLDPPIVMIAINRSGSHSDIFRDAPGFAVHILSAGQEDLSERFAATSPWHEKLGTRKVRPGLQGSPIIEGIATVIEARSDTCVDIGTHLVLFGEAIAIHSIEQSPPPPLLYFNRGYGTLDGGTDELDA